MPRWRIYWTAQVSAGLLFALLHAISCFTFGLLFFRLSVKGKDNVRNLSGPLIITPNHKSYADHFFILLALLFLNVKLLPARFLAADWLLQVPWYKLGFIVRWGLKIAGAYPTRKKAGLNVSLRDPMRVLKKGRTVAIYPEGGIRFRPGVHEVKGKGAAYLAQKSGAAVLPVAIRGIEYLSWCAFLFGRRKVIVIFGKPFFASQEETPEEVSREIKIRIHSLYDPSTPSEKHCSCPRCKKEA